MGRNRFVALRRRDQATPDKEREQGQETGRLDPTGEPLLVPDLPQRMQLLSASNNH